MVAQESTPRAQDEDSLSPLEQEVLDEYARLASNLGNVSISYSLSYSIQNNINTIYHITYRYRKDYNRVKSIDAQRLSKSNLG